jgi:hypothetical protein
VTGWTVAIGVDTHKQWHVAVALDRLGRQIDCLTAEATAAGYCQLLGWDWGLGQPVFGVEGCGSYGAGLARFLEDRGVVVYECDRPRRGDRRSGKNDLIDAALAAGRVVTGEGLSLPRGGGQREQLRILLVDRRGATRARIAALNQLDAVIVTAPDDVRRRLTGVSKRRLVPTAMRLRPRSDGVTDVLRPIACRVETLSQEIRRDRPRALAIIANNRAGGWRKLKTQQARVRWAAEADEHTAPSSPPRRRRSLFAGSPPPRARSDSPAQALAAAPAHPWSTRPSAHPDQPAPAAASDAASATSSQARAPTARSSVPRRQQPPRLPPKFGWIRRPRPRHLDSLLGDTRPQSSGVHEAEATPTRW